MKFTQSGGQSAVGPEDWFTGIVHIDGIRNPDDQAAVGCAHVRFTPGARTAWHTHPKGQTLYVTDGIGYVAHRGGESRRSVRVMSSTSSRARSTGTAQPGTDSFMAHIAIQEADESGQVVAWGDQVTDAEYHQSAS
jgi:hypothetical protein